MTWQHSDAASMPDPVATALRPPKASASLGEDTPAGLLRRADLLLDEMMMAGVDFAGGTLAPAGQHGAPLPPMRAASETGSWPGATPPPAPAPGTNMPGEARTDTNGVSAASAPPPPRTERLISAADRYAAATGTPVPLPSTSAGRLPPGLPPGAAPGAAPPPPQMPTAPVDTDSRVPDPPWARPSNGGEDGAAGPPRNSAIRSQSSLASMMTVGTRAAMRSTLLPRSGDANAEGLQQEIRELMTEVTSTLSAGNESYERSRHLLNKAQAILQSDPLRTAEAEYYLQQVRRIVQRAHQRNTWSAVYRKRLTLYLICWTALTLLVLVTSILYADALVAWALTQANSDMGAELASFVPMALWALSAGALGAALMELLAMRRYARRPYGLFDRKYGLRGLLMPILGLSIGLIFAVIWGTLLWALGIDPAERLWVGAVPTVLAFLAGLTQRWFYGVR